jgi:hypothetical protein
VPPAGVRVEPLDQLDNLYSISEQQITQDGKTTRKAIHVDTRGVNLILYHKDCFVYKFANPSPLAVGPRALRPGAEGHQGRGALGASGRGLV